MRQVPQYSIIGNGRVAQHMCHYLKSLDLPFSHWHRQTHYSLQETVKNATHVLLLIKDSAIEPFITEHTDLTEKTLIHFSGCHLSDRAFGAHPLMTFSNVLYPTSNYRQIPFIIEQTTTNFAELLPGLPNPHFTIPRQMKAYYHSLCVMTNNFTTLLWQKFFKELATRWQIPEQATFPFLQQTLTNLQQQNTTALTGPLARNDQATISQNLQALKDDPFQAVYASFVQAYIKSNQK
ncbi:MAG: DUF2520 domain-containing protein [Gammaproteobacteria bacterium]